MARVRTKEPERALCTVAEAAELLSMSRRSIYALLASAAIRRIKLGRATRIDLRELDRLIEAGGTTAWR